MGENTTRSPLLAWANAPWANPSLLAGLLYDGSGNRRIKKTQHFDVVVRLENGGTQTVSYPTQPNFKVGDKVRVENGVLVANA